MKFSQNPNFNKGLLLLIVGLLGLIFILGSWYSDRVAVQEEELRQIEVNKKIAWEKYFAVDLRVPLDQIKMMPDVEHVVVAGIDFTLHNAVQDVQNRSFDSLSINELDRIALINIFAPSALKATDLEKFIFFQALNYSTIIKRLDPKTDLNVIWITVYSRGGAIDNHMGYKIGFDFKQMVNLTRFGYEPAYEIWKSGNKKATIK